MAEERDKAAAVLGDGMPLGQMATPQIKASQVKVKEGDAAAAAEFDDDAACEITWRDYQTAAAWLDRNNWLAEWQYIDELYQSPNFDYDWRNANRAARISRFNIAKNSNTMGTQVRRGLFSDSNPFVLEPMGKLAGMPDAQTYLDAWTEIFRVLSERADLEYEMGLASDCQALQGTMIVDFGWEEKEVKRRSRKPKTPPTEVNVPMGTPKIVHTLESDDWEEKDTTEVESWPFFEFRRLGTTLYDEKWRTPNRPEKSAGYKINVDYVAMEDLRQMRKMTCYKDIPEDAELIKFFLANPDGDASAQTQTADNLNQPGAMVLHASGEEKNTSANPFEHPFMKVARWDGENVFEILIYNGRKKTIRNEAHDIGDFAFGGSATWWNIPNSGYGMGIGRLNAGDQRMDQGVLNEVLKMIAYWTNAPMAYNSADGNAPTQNMVMGLATLWGINAGPGGDVRKSLGYIEKPPIPKEAFQIYELGKSGGEDLVGANSGAMQGNITGTQGIARTAAGVNRASSQSDAQVAGPISNNEIVMTRWYQFLWKMAREEMPIKEIREILSDKFSDAVMKTLDAGLMMDAKFNIKILAGQKLAAKAAILQLIPFLMQLTAQPQLMQFNHEIGKTVNYGAIEKLFIRLSELAGWEESIFVDMTPEQQQAFQQNNPAMQRTQAQLAVEQAKGANKQKEIMAQGAQNIQETLVDKALDHVEGAVPLDLAEARLARNTDMRELQNGVGE
jgi:hypothetical protein